MLDALKSNPDITAQLISQNRQNHMNNPNNQMVINNQQMNNHGMNPQMNSHGMNPQMQMANRKFTIT